MMRNESGIRLKHVARPKYAEEFKSTERAGMTPWEVAMLVQSSEVDPEVYKTVYYVRAARPDFAATMANNYWTQWEKKDMGLEFEKYPDTVDQAAVLCLDEGDWAELWEEAQRYRHRFAGMIENPSVFTFWKPGYGVVDKKPLARVGEVPAGWQMAGGGIIHPPIN